ncbi:MULTISPECIES: hypothetical protein [unclassified Pseudonocardia]|uniref:hypothetical protein n=1 Tax=unclassified Pseudonocardia TaxID=2619320 RepID=UPI0001FFDD5F|nr:MULTISPECIES: hypothetical protein [unclassified Pseudonocardia]ALE72118.1 hypothetical protein FRP1_01375 [Pseudonocardia sp. EC080625-04]ALL75404.1 hypothetical protein AD006_09005 [Pseudonocardia sp. EC080610-09]ALL82430.1 hypothetical protein AD017_16835 [Pseudonocardia sp. EC080619-01]OLM20807.1 hypothetical protein Ae707Ps1_5066c [Pseudonocardia sp. Ae707_Ps1]
MSETPSRKPRHALSDTGPAVPTQGGPRDDEPAGVRADVPEQQAWSPAEDRAERVEVPARPDVQATGDAPAVPQPAPAGDELFTPHAGDPADEAPTQALPVIPRPRDDRASWRGPHAVAQLPEPFRPAPVRGTTATVLPSSVRPVLPAVLGAATAIVLALGVVAGVNGAPDPAPAPAPPAPVSGP